MELQMQLVQAVHVLNHDMLSCNRVAANQWLVQFQQTDAAWQVATGILTAEALNIHDFEVELFAAQILKRKIHSDIGTLLPDGRRALQNALLVSATKHSSGPSQLLTQICLALSALIFRSPEARSLIQQLFGRLYELQCQGSGSHAVLELLTVLPEEVTEEKTIVANVNSDHRRQFSNELLSHSSSVLKFLVHLTENEAHFYTVRIGCLLEIDQLAVPSHPLIAFAFACLQVPESFSVAIEVLAELINRHEVIPPAVLLQMIVVKDTLLLPALATGNEVVVKGLCWLMAELGQSAPGLFARGTPDVLSLEEAMLGCTRFQSSNWEVAETSLSFWSALGDYLINLGFEKQSGLRAYIPLYISLLDALVLRVQVGPKSYNEDDIDGSTGLPDSLAQFRINLEETTTTVCRLLGPTQYVTQLLSQITLELPVLWQVIEAQFFLLYAASEAILDGPALDLSSLVNVFLAISEERPETVAGLDLLYKSAAQVLGAFSRWICNHPTVVLPLLSFLASGLSAPLAASACATALRRICEEVSAMASDPANLECLLWIGEGLHNFKLSPKEEEEVLCAIGRSLSTVTSSAVLNDALHRLLKPTYDPLKELLIADVENRLKFVSAESAMLLESSVRALHRLGTIFSQFPVLSSSSVIGEEVFVGILSQFWPLLEQMFSSAFMENNSLATAVCKCLSEATKTGGQCILPLLPNITKFSSENFVSFQTHVCFLKLANTLTEEHGHQKEYAPLFVEVAGVFSTADSVAALSSSYACDNEPDVAEAYMNFMSTFLRNCHKGVLATAESHVEAALNRATICCTVMHRGAALAAMSYISCLLEMALSSLTESVDCPLTAAVLKICTQCGESIVSGMLYALLGPSAMSRVYKATTILQQLAAICNSGSSRIGWSALQCWIVSAIQALPAEYLRHGEAERLSVTWLEALRAAASDVDAGNSIRQRGGNGGRSLKRVLRDFVEQHKTNLICVS
ncbi:hypothetical protein SELMODRAFT_446653 [Selaginella moellendorffii]|uniref:Exportin-1/Importin-beta-like domain-containing protein n=1 Tax=Selaginella moellendorffii TaxID=88036 RepID=D8STA3_SELML|nr:transportin MOS14 isoform X2 [Selaginella moellendorffii]EFJ12365.1 hypothetical protein SELMODRAFT_446653 [Selaginella moellendorffii]|eukprot:XP_002986508.1 transportin MOS14 isoform X2 [Selaginella moellendorffii]